MNLELATARAKEIVKRISPYCANIEIAGSIRRKCSDVGDIEIVAIPLMPKLRELRDIVNVEWGRPEIGKFPSRYTRIRSIMQIDFFWPSPQTWGMTYFIRTGSAEFVRGALSHWKAITHGGYSKDCVLHLADDTTRPTPEETDVFTALEWKWTEPEKRF